MRPGGGHRPLARRESFGSFAVGEEVRITQRRGGRCSRGVSSGGEGPRAVGARGRSRPPRRRTDAATRLARAASRGAFAVGLAAAWLVLLPQRAAAQDAVFAVPRVSPEAKLVVPIEESGDAALGRGWHPGRRQFVSQRGTCIAYDTSGFEPAEEVHASLETLSRAGGHLRLGLHVAVYRGVESVEGARLVDAARRLARHDLQSFRALCGDTFAAGTVAGAQFLGELEVGSQDGAAAHAWLQRRRVFGATTNLERLAEMLEDFVGRFPVRAQILIEGRRGAAKPIDPLVLIAGAADFPNTSDAERAGPFLALLLEYPEYMRSGLALDFAMRPPAEPGRAVFAAMRPRRSAASEMHLARSTRRPPPPAPVATPVFRVERFPVRVIERGDIAVYAGPTSPPDLFVQHVGTTHFWVPGAASGTPRVRAAIAGAMTAMAPSPEVWPLRWVRRYAAGGAEGMAVYLSPDAPIDGTHSGRAAEGYAWIPGVAAPNPRERTLVDAVLKAATPPVSTGP